MSSPKFPAISEPTPNIQGLYNSVVELKQAMEILTRQRKPITSGAITWQDLVDLGLITEADVPDR